MINLTISVADICQNTFGKEAFGSKVVNSKGFWDALCKAMDTYEFPTNGQGFIEIDAVDFVSCGATRRAGLSIDDYHIREHRGEICLCAKRNYAAKAQLVNCVVYTKDAYCSDPQVEADDLRFHDGATHVLVAVIASVGPSPVSSHRFTRNLAGGNKRYFPTEGYTIEQAVKEAGETVEYEQAWITVAD